MWLADVMQWVVVVIAPTARVRQHCVMLGYLSRYVYSLATNRQIPSYPVLDAGDIDAARGDRNRSGDGVRPRDPGRHRVSRLRVRVRRTVGHPIAHLSVIRLRVIDPDRERPIDCH